MKAYEGVDVYLHALLNSALDGGELSASRLQPLDGRGRAHQQEAGLILEQVGFLGCSVVQMCLKVCACYLHSSGAGYSRVMISRDHSHDPSPILEYLDRMWEDSALTVR